MSVNRTSPTLRTSTPYGGGRLRPTQGRPTQGLRLSRSPHPYHRRGSHGIQHDSALPTQKFNENWASQRATTLMTAPTPPEKGFDGANYCDTDGRKRRKYSTTPSESGTEADDESGGVLRGLPAPPFKSRKGIKDSRNFATPSPLLTPTLLDEHEREFSLEDQPRHGITQNPPSIDEERSRRRDKFTRRRRAELLRRMTETVLIGSIGCIACGKGSASPFRAWKRELLAHGLVLSGTYLLYPLRIIYGQSSSTSHGPLSLARFKIPASFDPAPLLYPTLIPVFVALSLAAINPRLLLPNLVLSIASIPRQVIPFYESFFGYGLVQWFLSIIPVAVFKGRALITPVDAGADLLSLDLLSAENLTVLYPLHQALLPSLSYLTTTSLLPAELQLLSVSMINVLFFSQSPQALILKALLWIGGLSIFILCGAVLKWAVALARVPNWRFRNPRRRFRKGSNSMISKLLNGFVSRNHESSDSENSEASTAYAFQKKRARRKMRHIHEKDESRPRADSTMPMSAVDSHPPVEFPGSPSLPIPYGLQKNRQRRHTLPSYITWPADIIFLDKPKNSTFSRFLFNLDDPRSFMSLTETQATIVKWSYALYVYAVVLVIVMIPIRTYVSWFALHNQEPLGWALGYLFGNLPFFRLSVSNLNAGNWIPLPPLGISRNWVFYDLSSEIRNLGSANTRLLICFYCINVIAIGLGIVFRLSAFVEVDTRRKVFHGMMVVMFLPSILIDPPFAALALILVLAIFLLLDLFRASQLPPLSRPLTNFLAPYVDGRDHRGPVIVSHIFLLIGCAIPLWLSLAAVPRTGLAPWQGWEVSTRDLGMISGVVCVGMGDAAASLFGRRFGRRRWCWSGGKSLEGSLAFTMAVVLGLGVAKVGLRLGGWVADGRDMWVLTLGKAVVAAAGASLTEAVLTGGNDNVIVPVILWLLVRGLGI